MANESVQPNSIPHQTMTRVDQDDPRRGTEVAYIGFAPPPKDMPPPRRNALRELVVNLWSRLDAIAWNASLHTQSDESAEQLRKELERISDKADVQSVYVEMQRLLSEIEDGNQEREDDLHRQLGNVFEMNSALRRENARLKADLQRQGASS